MSNDAVSFEDEAYIAAIAADPKMVMDEVGADIEEHGHVPVTAETATQDPFTTKGCLANALDEALEGEPNDDAVDADGGHEDKGLVGLNGKDSKLLNPTNDFRDETKGEVEGTTDTSQNILHLEDTDEETTNREPTIQQDKAVMVKDSLAEALDSITMDADPKPDYSDYSEENASAIKYKAPDVPESLGGDPDKPDENGLVYVTATFTVDPNAYVSNNYKPKPNGNTDIKNAAKAGKTGKVGKASQAPMADGGEPVQSGNGESAEDAEAMEADEPTAKQEEQAAKQADKDLKQEQQKKTNGEDIVEEEKEEKVIINDNTNTKGKSSADKEAQDEAPEKVVLDFATYIDGSSFMCFDEVEGIDYTKIAMDAGPKKPVTRANCQTTFAQCRAQNPLFCRFHGPKLLEADIKTQLKAAVGSGCIVSVTKDKGAKDNKFKFRLTVGCPPSKKKMVEKMIHMFLTQNPGISSPNEEWNLAGEHKQTQEFEMDVLQADKPPKRSTSDKSWEGQALADTKKAKKLGKKQAVVGDTPAALEKQAAKGEKWKTVDEATENEWAQRVDWIVHKTMIGGNKEFMDKYEEIANQFDAAHDAGDVEGLKKALADFNAEVEKYDWKTGQKKEGVEQAEELKEEQVEEETEQTAEQPTEQTEEPEAQPTKAAKGKKRVAPQGKAEVQEQTASNEAAKPQDKYELEEAFNEAIMAFPDDAEGEAFSQNLELQNKFSKAFKADDIRGMKEAIEGMKALANGGGDETSAEPQTVLPAPSSVAKKKETNADANVDNGDSSSPSTEQSPIQPILNDFEEHKQKFSEVKQKFNDTCDFMSQEESTTIGGYVDEAFWQKSQVEKHLKEYDFAKKSLTELDAPYNAHLTPTKKEVDKKMLNASMDTSLEKAVAAMTGMQSAINNAQSAMDIWTSVNDDKQKGQVADAVEKAVKYVANVVYPDGPVDGVDSAKEMASHKVDVVEAELKKNVGKEAEAQLATKHKFGEHESAAIKAAQDFDSLIQQFKEKMDGGGSFGEIAKVAHLITESGYSVYDAFAKLDNTIKLATNEAQEMIKLNKAKERLSNGNGKETKKKLGGGGEQGASSSGSVTIADIEDFFDTHYDEAFESGQKLLHNWLELFNQGTISGNSPKNFLESMGGWLQGKMKQKGSEHPVTKALIKAGLNAPDGMENQAEPNAGGEQSSNGAEKKQMSDEEKKAKIAAMSPKQKLEAAVKIFKKKLAAAPSNAEAKAKLAKYEAMLAKLNK